MPWWLRYLTHWMSSTVWIPRIHMNVKLASTCNFSPQNVERGDPWSHLANQNNHIGELWVQLRDLISMNKVGNDQEKISSICLRPTHTTPYTYAHHTIWTFIRTCTHTYTYTAGGDANWPIVQGMSLLPGPSVDLLSRTPLQVHLEAPLHHLVKMGIWPGSILVSFHPSSEEPDVDM